MKLTWMCVIEMCFLISRYFSTKTCVVGTQKNIQSHKARVTYIATCYTRGEFNNARARRALVDWYLSLFVMCKAWHQYNERLTALALLNSPQNVLALTILSRDVPG